MRRFAWIGFCLVLAWPALGHTEKPDMEGGASPSGEGGVRPTRNPFMDTPVAQSRGRAVSSPSLPAGVPSLNLRGYIENEDGTALALLEVQGHTLYVVRAGDMVSLRAGQQAVQLTVERIGHASMQVRIGEAGPTMEVR